MSCTLSASPWFFRGLRAILSRIPLARDLFKLALQQSSTVRKSAYLQLPPSFFTSYVTLDLPLPRRGAPATPIPFIRDT